MPRRQLGGFAQQGCGMSNKRRVDYSRVAELAAAGMRTVAEIRDDLHELRIKREGLLLEWAVLDGYQMLANWHRKEMERLIAQRSPEQVARMEAAIDKAVGEA